MRRNGGALLGVTLLAILGAVAVLSWVATPADPYTIAVERRFQGPSAAHPFGTDDLGRDVLSRVMVGTRISFGVASFVLAIASGLGVPLGVLSGYRGGWLDEIIMRASDIFLAFPSFLLAMAIVAALGSSLTNAVLALGIAWWPRYARLLRGQVLSVKQSLYVDAARAVGARDNRVLARHILPNCGAPLLVQLATDAGNAILITASLSFVGLGAKPPSPEWGFMVAQGRQFLLTAWWVPIFPGLAIATMVAAFLFMGDGLRDVLDPRLRGSST
ncbi:MAG: ABC transporter permease [Armatimonadota bacterium]|nr:ABC transporter permease [Armatimonadota bacterium]MDR7422241.1 ABC transporter permease [Armatimonadota bacterium]MDR7453860.1 ABC transporter permease [Armatimonadota bacterium]MDR7495695.1 ABC transporter permease [Armatimonadota bacterium]MDR7511059.1 ABC transporter permease [Armatimonadota bacterium]